MKMAVKDIIRKMEEDIKNSELQERKRILNIYKKIQTTLKTVPEEKLFHCLDLYFDQTEQMGFKIHGHFDGIDNTSEAGIESSFRNFSNHNLDAKLHILASNPVCFGVPESNPWAIGYRGGGFYKVEYQGENLKPVWVKPLKILN
jgi:hypothetical protein